MSDHSINVVRIESLNEHPNAERLQITSVGGYTVCVQKGQYQVGDLACYLPPDSVAPDTPPFAFLNSHRRIKVKKLRGVISQGLMMPLAELTSSPGAWKEGDDVAETFNIQHYEPAEDTRPANFAKPPADFPKYDVENWAKFHRLIPEGTPVIITEKVDGSSMRVVWKDNQLHVGSRRYWVQDGPNWYWNSIHQNPWIKEFAEANPDLVIYGEVFGGNIQNFKYGCKSDEYRFRVFDLYKDSQWLDWSGVNTLEPFVPWSAKPRHLSRTPSIKDIWVPILYIGPLSIEQAKQLAEGKSTIADGVKEGCVIRPLENVYDMRLGRVQVKIVGNDYMSRQ